MHCLERLACTSGFILWKGERVRSYDVKHSTSMKAVGILFGSSLVSGGLSLASAEELDSFAGSRGVGCWI